MRDILGKSFGLFVIKTNFEDALLIFLCMRYGYENLSILHVS
jgi:hypothetical protein